MSRIGIIGGSGLEDPDILQGSREISMITRYGEPSSSLLEGKINGKDVIILSRHGRLHTIPPTQVNNRANLLALKEAGCTHLLSSTACGSLREEIGRGDLVIPDQFIDFTRHRPVTFFESFEPGAMKHTSMADPFDSQLRNTLISVADGMDLPVHPSGTVITIEGPRFSTRAESRMFRAWGADLVNMSTAPEIILARELDLPYAAIAMSTDYDCWKEDEEPVSWEEVLSVFKRNVKKVTDLLKAALTQI
jgi:5'-methylthioadenosine phosphorylase